MFQSNAVATAFRYIVACAIVSCLSVSAAEAQNQLGGHFGVLFPLINHVNGETTDISENFVMGFPMGITVKTSDYYAFDLEVVPSLDSQDNGPIDVGLTVHPGVLASLSDSVTAGLRMAFDIGNASWGFTPLLNMSFPSGGLKYFVEVVLPVRFQDDSQGDSHTAIGLGVHLGVGF